MTSARWNPSGIDRRLSLNRALVSAKARHEELIGGGGGADAWAVGTQTHLPPKFIFSSIFGHFSMKMLEKN